MNAADLVNSAGLLFDIVGAVLIWRFGLPPEVSRSGASYLVVNPDDSVMAATKKMAARYDFLGRLGLALLIFGFFIQIVSNFV